MAVIRYTAVDRGDLISGHTEGTEYLIEIPINTWTPSRKRITTEKRPLSGGKKYTTLHRIEKYYDFKTVSEAGLSIIESFLELESSVAAGESFFFDPFGTIASPNVEYEVTLVGDIKPIRVSETEFAFSGRVEE